MSTRKAIVQARYGPPESLELRDLGVPVPGDGEVLVRVRAAAVNPVDWHLVRGEPALVRLVAGLRRPKRLVCGVDLAGVVEAVGPGVTGFRPGDEVFGAAEGSFTELACASAEDLAPKPERLTFEQAAGLALAGCTALQGIRDHGRLAPGQTVLVDGAAGGVGTLAVQIAKAMGADVTGTCGPANVELVRSLGADRVVDYTAEDVDGHFDLVLQVSGDRPLSELRRLGTTVVLIGSGVGRDGSGSSLGPLVRMAKARVLPGVAAFIAHVGGPDIAALGSLAEEGKLTPVVGATFPLAEAAQAVLHVEEGHARGKTIVSVAPSA